MYVRSMLARSANICPQSSGPITLEAYVQVTQIDTVTTSHSSMTNYCTCIVLVTHSDTVTTIQRTVVNHSDNKSSNMNTLPVMVMEAFSDPGITQVGSSKSKVALPLSSASRVFVFSYLTQPGCWIEGRG